MTNKKRKGESIGKPSLLELDLYKRVETFFSEGKNCEKIGSEVSRPISLRIFGGTIRPDVFGVTNPTSKDFKIYMAEGKLSFRGRDFDVCKGQAITLQRFADYVYLFFPKVSWDELDETEQSEVLSECKNLKLGLLIVDKDSCKEKVKAYPNYDLIEEEKRTDARDKMVQYFPDFSETRENVDFFEKYVKLADSIVKESFGLIDYLGGNFRKITPIKKSSIEHFNDEDYTFEFYRYYKDPKAEVFLIVKPFGSDIFETNSPTLLIQERFKSSIIKNHKNRGLLLKHMEDCLNRGGRVDTGDYIFYSPDKSEQVLQHIKESNPDDFSIFEQIKILGVEKEQIKANVEKSLQRIMNFLNSLK